MKTFDGLRWNTNSAYVANVKDFGAVGDGITDDADAVQAAFNSVRDNGGGTVVFPRATYFWSFWVEVFSNTKVDGMGSTLLKRVGSSATMFFGMLSHGKTGYGSGASNVEFTNLHLKGDLSQKRQAGLFGSNHAENILVDNCTFTECHMQGHILDIQGSRNITVRDCYFYGMNAEGSIDHSKECIQLDNSTRLGKSVNDDTGSFDGLPTTDVVVDNCKFLPITVNGVTYPAPNPLGSHWGMQGYYHERIKFTNNTVIDPPSDTSNGSRGVLKFCAARDITVSGNTFLSTISSNVSVFRHLPLQSTITPENADTATSSDSVSIANTPVQSYNIKFTSNTVSGFNASGSSRQTLIDLRGSKEGYFCHDVVISNNTFENCLTSDTSDGGPDLISAYRCEKIAISNNVTNSTRNLVVAQGNNISVTGNSISNCPPGVYAIFLDSCADSSISGNTLSDVGAGVLVNNDSRVVSVTGNTINKPKTGTGISFGPVNKCSRVANVVYGVGTTDYMNTGATEVLDANNLFIKEA